MSRRNNRGYTRQAGVPERGIGTQILPYAIPRANTHGVYLLQLTTDKQRLKAVRFVEPHGFVSSPAGLKLHLKPYGQQGRRSLT